MPSRWIARSFVSVVALAVFAVSCSSGSESPQARRSEGTGDAGAPTTGPSVTAPTPAPPASESPFPTGVPTPLPTTGGRDGGGGSGIFLTEGGTYQITSVRMIYVAKQKFTVVSPKVWFGSIPTPNFPKGAYLATDTGAFLSNGGTWTNASSRDLKDHLRPVDPDAVLRAVARLPVSTWHYRSEAAAVRHLGPMAEDFFKAFHLGQDDRHIATVDEEGVALAAIKALAKRTTSQARQIASLRTTLTRLAGEVRRLEHHRAG
jgi:hypothetical protein